jgi:hypothetical protein
VRGDAVAPFRENARDGDIPLHPSPRAVGIMMSLTISENQGLLSHKRLKIKQLHLRFCEPFIPQHDPIDKPNTCGRGTMNSLRQNDQDWRPHPTNVPRIANTILSTTWPMDWIDSRLRCGHRYGHRYGYRPVGVAVWSNPVEGSWRRSSFPDSNTRLFHGTGGRGQSQ